MMTNTNLTNSFVLTKDGMGYSNSLDAGYFEKFLKGEKFVISFDDRTIVLQLMHDDTLRYDAVMNVFCLERNIEEFQVKIDFSKRLIFISKIH